MILGTDLAARFRASVLARRDHRTGGFAELTLPEMQPLRFEALFGNAVPAEETGPGGIVLLMVLEGAPLRLGSLVVATVSPDAALPGCDIWDLMGGQVEGLLRFQFDAQGRISFRR